MLSTEEINDHSRWISVFEPLPRERADLIKKYEVTQELLDYAIDPYEKARVEVDPDAGVTLLIFDVYVPTHAVTAPQTAPIGIMLTTNNIITFTNAKTNFVNGIIANQLKVLQKRGPITDKLNLVFPVLYRLSTNYSAGSTSSGSKSSVTCKSEPGGTPLPSSWKSKLVWSTC